MYRETAFSAIKSMFSRQVGLIVMEAVPHTMDVVARSVMAMSLLITHSQKLYHWTDASNNV